MIMGIREALFSMEVYMIKDKVETLVVFRVFKDHGDVVALFPELVLYTDGSCESYQHIGQHGAADYTHCIRISRAAPPKEYAALQAELNNIGYNLKIRQKYSPRN
jgi:hypothetical protein